MDVSVPRCRRPGESDGCSRRRARLARYLSNGSLDPNFGSGGLVVTHIPGPSGSDTAYDVALQADGRIVVAGLKSEAQFEMIAIRYQSDGSLDPSFGVNGIARPSLPGSNSAFALAIQSSRRRVIPIFTIRSPNEPMLEIT